MINIGSNIHIGIIWAIILVILTVSACGTAINNHHKRKLQLIKARARAAEYRAAVPRVSTSQPEISGCPHGKVTPVRLSDGTLVRWVCANPVCMKEFPPESAILEGEE